MVQRDFRKDQIHHFEVRFGPASIVHLVSIYLMKM